MELVEFLNQTQDEVNSEIDERRTTPGNVYPYPESIFAEVVMTHMSEIGMTFEPVTCHYSARVGNANLRLSGYAISEESDQIDLFVSLYDGVREVTAIPDSDTKTAAEQCLRFLSQCVSGRLARTMDASSDAYSLVLTIKESYANLDQIRVYVLTDRQAKSKNFKPREVNGKTVKLEVMDIERLHRHWSEGKPRDELVVNFEEVSGGPLPCIYVPGEDSDYSYALTVFPGEALRFVYEKYGARLLEANVRSFLSVTGKVNKGIRDTLQQSPERFVLYNNGIVVVADEISLGEAPGGGAGILWLKGMQIVNGGQTTASIYYSKKRDPSIDLRRVRVPAKIIVLKSVDASNEEALISDISKFANSQNSVKLSDFSANKPFHVELEKLALSTYCPDGVSRWFYERAAGSYNVMLAREGNTPARLKRIRDAIPPARKITKTDLAKYQNAWARRPHDVSFGSQKNFERFMAQFEVADGEPSPPLPDLGYYKQMIAKAIIFKVTEKLVRPLAKGNWAKVVAYTVSYFSDKLGSRIDLEKIWVQQDLSSAFKQQISDWAMVVNEVLLASADSAGKKGEVAEWCKKEECWDAVRKASYPAATSGLPEIRSN